VLLFIVIVIVFVCVGILLLSCRPNSDETATHSADQTTEPSAGVGQYLSGGRNVEAYKYVHTEGHPSIPDKVKFVGTLKGSWYKMEKQLGERSDSDVRYPGEFTGSER